MVIVPNWTVLFMSFYKRDTGDIRSLYTIKELAKAKKQAWAELCQAQFKFG